MHCLIRDIVFQKILRYCCRINSPTWKGLDKARSVIYCSKKGRFLVQGRSWRLYSLEKVIFPSDHLDGQRKRPDAHQCSKKCPNTSADTNHREHLFAQMSGQPNKHLELRAHVRCSVRTANWGLRTVKIACNRPNSRAVQTCYWRLLKKIVYFEVGCCLMSGRPLSKFECRLVKFVSVLI